MVSFKDNTIFDKTSFLEGSNTPFIEELYLKYINNPYICVLNGDDYFLRNSLNTVVKELESKPDILIGNGFIVDSNNYLIKKFISARVSTENYIKSDVSITMASICHQATFYRKKIFEKKK